jgi:hypothetical protein
MRIFLLFISLMSTCFAASTATFCERFPCAPGCGKTFCECFGGAPWCDQKRIAVAPGLRSTWEEQATFVKSKLNASEQKLACSKYPSSVPGCPGAVKPAGLK